MAWLNRGGSEEKTETVHPGISVPTSKVADYNRGAGNRRADWDTSDDDTPAMDDPENA